MPLNYDLERSEWLYNTTPPFSGPGWSPTQIEFFNIHYTGDNKTYVGKSEVATLNAIQKDYVNSRGYSFGYACAVGLSGTTYEGRGTKYRAASNGSPDNYQVFSCLLICGVPDEIPLTMINGVRRLYTEICTMLGRALTINGHKDMGSTACPGDKAYALVKNGSFYPKKEAVNDMETLRIPRRIIDTRESGGPITGSRSFDLKSSSTTFSDAEITVTCIPNTAEAGFAGLGPTDSFCNWLATQKGVPIPQTLSVPVTAGKVALYFSTSCHVIITVRAEG